MSPSHSPFMFLTTSSWYNAVFWGGEEFSLLQPLLSDTLFKKKNPKKFTFTLANVLHLQGGFMGKGWYFHSNKGFFPENWWISKAQNLVQSPEVPGWKTKQMVNPLHFYFFRIIFFLPVILHFPPCPKCLLCNEFLICDGFKAVPSGVGNQQHQGLIWEGTGTPSCSENIRDFLYIERHFLILSCRMMFYKAWGIGTLRIFAWWIPSLGKVLKGRTWPCCNLIFFFFSWDAAFFPENKN